MSRHSTNTFSSLLVAAVTTAATSNSIQQSFNEELLPYPACEICEGAKSGMPIMFYNHASEDFARSMNISSPVEIGSIKMQLRHTAIENSFFKHSNGIPSSKKEYLLALSNTVCRLQFNDIVSSYNEDDETIDTVLKLPNGLTLSISQFLCDEVKAPVVFSIHREKTLLIADEMSIDELVDTINSVVAKVCS